ncbi:MAG: phosphoglucosamine mutase [Acidobacteria bacterium]|nr:phosphoglucosamine mutase [Acidobacteriota bacterium]
MKTKRLFGTDGIRAPSGTFPLDPATIARVGAALVRTLAGADPAGGAIRILIGRDTRESGEWIEETLARAIEGASGVAAAAGVVTTAGVACLTRSSGFDAGIVISASHNPWADNGIKIFSRDGYKLPDADEARIEGLVLDEPIDVASPAPAKGPRAKAPGLRDEYERHLVSAAGGRRLDGMRIALDCANGASHETAPNVFTALGAAVTLIGAAPDGRNINSDCGSLHPARLRDAVLKGGADLGCAFDGDADRCVLVDEKGRICDGDFILSRAALALQAEGKLAGNLVVATVMSNLWLERALKAAGIRMLRAPVGDKYVLEEMLRTGARLGGEQSGHVIFLDHATTGDGILTALTLAAIVRSAGVRLSAWFDEIRPCPQILVNVRVSTRPDLEKHPVIGARAREVRTKLGDSGRLLLRYSGTEPLARVMIEAEDPDQVRSLAREMADAIEREIGER